MADAVGSPQKTGIVTGGSRGLGRGIVEAISGHGLPARGLQRAEDCLAKAGNRGSSIRWQVVAAVSMSSFRWSR
jgi:hypothetical protein